MQLTLKKFILLLIRAALFFLGLQLISITLVQHHMLSPWRITGVALVFVFVWMLFPQQKLMLTEGLSGIGMELKNKPLRRLLIGTFILYGLISASFLVLPIFVLHFMQISAAKQWSFVVPIMLVSAVLTWGLFWLAQAKQQLKRTFTGAIFALLIAETILFSYDGASWQMALALLLTFTAFFLLSWLLIALIMKLAKAAGAAIFLYSIFQLLGVLVGAFGTLVIYDSTSVVGDIFVFCMAGAVIWFVVAMNMQYPQLQTKK